MNEAEKCPVCRSDGRKERGREDGEYVAYYVCDTCLFMCGLEDLPRIAAAMELARARVDLKNCAQDDIFVHLDGVNKAASRALKVFGGE